MTPPTMIAAQTRTVVAVRAARPRIAVLFRRLSLRRERYGPRSTERLPESPEHCQVSVKCDSFQLPNPQRGKSVIRLQSTELALNARAATVETLPFVGAI